MDGDNEHGASPAPCVDDARAIFAAALAAVRPDRLFARADVGAWLPPVAGRGKTVVLGAGKASVGLAGALEACLGEQPVEGFVVVPHGYLEATPADLPRPTRIGVREAGHPVPDAAGVEAAAAALAAAAACGADDRLLVLISGGGSALWPAFAEGISLADAQATFRLLLASGADIHAVNTVRKHLSRIGGGRLAVAAHPAPVRALLVSDVVGDDPAVIASGPTTPDPTTFADAVGVVRAAGLWDRLPPSVRAHLQRGAGDAALETPGPGHPAFARVETRLLGRNRDALEGARREAMRRGYRVVLQDAPVTGEARVVGRRLGHTLRGSGGRVCRLWGGETTVTVRGGGRGGRNQEVALGAAQALDGWAAEAVLLSGGTDGVDGPTDAAGAWSTPETLRRAAARGLDADRALAENDSHPFFDALGQLLRPGPTHTNVMDVQVGLVAG